MSKNGKNLIIVGCIICLVLILTVIVVLGNNNVYVKYYDRVTKVIDKAFDEATNVTDEDTSRIGASGKITVDLDLSENILTSEEAEMIQQALNGVELSYDMKFDDKEKFAQLYVSASKNSEELINADLVVIENTGYLKVKDILDKYYKFDSEEQVEFTADTEDLELINDVEVIYEIAKKEIRKQLNSKNISNENVKLEINNEEVSVKKHTLTINEEMIYNIELAIFDKIVNDEKALEAYANIINSNSYYESTMEEIKTDLIDSMDSIKEDLDEIIAEKKEQGEEYTEYASIINVYTKGFRKDIVKIELGMEYEGEFEPQIVFNVNELDDNKVEYVLSDGSDEVFKCVVEEKAKNTYNIEIEIEDVKITLEGTITDEKIDLSYRLITEVGEIKGNILVEAENDENAKLKFSIENELLGKAGINLEMNIYEEFDIPDVSGATTTLDESEVEEKLMNKSVDIMNKLGIDIMNFGQEEETYLPELDWEEDYYNDDYSTSVDVEVVGEIPDYILDVSAEVNY